MHPTPPTRHNRAMRAALVAIAAAAAPAHADDHGRVPVIIADGICDTFMLTLATPLARF